MQDKPQNDPEKYVWGLFYVDPDDKRIIVPKRIPEMGWTINFGNPRTGLYFLLVILVTLALSFLIHMFAG